MRTPQVNLFIKRISLLIIMISAAVIAATGIARADGTLTAGEERFGDEIAVPLCDYIDTAGVTEQSMMTSMKIIYRHTPGYMDMSDAVDIINYVVENYCPSHWNDLVAFGNRYRGASYA